MTEQVYNRLLKCPQVPPEIGGLLGGNNLIISTVIFDDGFIENSGIKYVPNINYLNQCICEWYENGIEFYGIFHTHSKNWPTLSNEDQKYIEVILNAMPDDINQLYFPLVFPRDKVIMFSAVKNKETFHIFNEDIEII